MNESITFLYKGSFGLTPNILTWEDDDLDFYANKDDKCIISLYDRSSQKLLKATASFSFVGDEDHDEWTGNSIIQSITCSFEFIKLLALKVSCLFNIEELVFYPKNNKKFYHYLKSRHKYLK